VLHLRSVDEQEHQDDDLSEQVAARVADLKRYLAAQDERLRAARERTLDELAAQAQALRMGYE
jgi:hypothetical protein